MFTPILLLLYFYHPPTLLLPINHLLSTKISTQYTTLFTCGLPIIPNVGMFCSQYGNVLFPVWEYFVPNVGIKSVELSV